MAIVTTLFNNEEFENYLLDIHYQGPSFDGEMEISQLGTEIQGLDRALKIIIHTLAKHKKLAVKASEIEIYIEGFEKGSFRERVKICVKTVEAYPTTSVIISGLLAATMNLIPQLTAKEIQTMSPELKQQIQDEVKISLLSNKDFQRSLAAVMDPLQKNGDKITATTTNKTEVVISHDQKEEFIKLAEQTDRQPEEEHHPNDLDGRITRVDLDATKNHLGFKINDEGVTILCTFKEQLKEEEMTRLLGKWVRISGEITYVDGKIDRIDIDTYKLITPQIQPTFNF